MSDPAADEPPRQREVLGRRLGIARRVVVEQDERGRARDDGLLEHLARVHEARGQAADRDDRLALQAMAHVEREQAERLDRPRAVARQQVARGVGGRLESPSRPPASGDASRAPSSSAASTRAALARPRPRTPLELGQRARRRGRAARRRAGRPPDRAPRRRARRSPAAPPAARGWRGRRLPCRARRSRGRSSSGRSSIARPRLAPPLGCAASFTPLPFGWPKHPMLTARLRRVQTTRPAGGAGRGAPRT